ncbi:MAG: ABC transporter permease subunit [Acidobacteria bacterium]|nr:ABC transporter permease subunit [Acidobacteriota bacterium]
MSPDRIGVMIGKELREFRANPAAVAPVIVMMAVCIGIPFLILTVLPAVTGKTLAEDREIAQVVRFAQDRLPMLSALPPAAAAQAFLFQQFLMLFLLAPIVGAVSLAAYSVVGEKQGRTLEPLLTTPLTAAELLLAKVLACILPALAIEIIGLGLYAVLMALFAEPGVLPALLSARSAVLVGLVGPLASLAALQLTIAVSSRVNDPRSAQQVAVLLVLPLVGLLIGQIIGAFIIPTWGLLVVAAVLAAVWGILIVLGVALFDRERILTGWK